MRELLPKQEIAARLSLIFPRDAFDPVLSSPLAASAVAAMLYTDAIRPDDGDIGPEQGWARPTTVLWLSDEVYAREDEASRVAWRTAALRSAARRAVGDLQVEWGLPRDSRWYADNSRETLRDETFPSWRQYGAVTERADLPHTSSKPRWALLASFADLFDPALIDDALVAAIEAWRNSHMAPGDLLRIDTLLNRSRSAAQIEVTLPDGTSRALEPGDASHILKGVLEQWAPARLVDAVVVTVSEPGDKVYTLDAARLKTLGVTIDPQTLLPDAVVADVGVRPAVFWIIEVAASDGVVTAGRRDRLLEWASLQRIPTEHCSFLTAFMDRNSAPAKRRLKDLAVDTYAWFATEPTRELAWREIERPHKTRPFD